MDSYDYEDIDLEALTSWEEQLRADVAAELAKWEYDPLGQCEIPGYYDHS